MGSDSRPVVLANLPRRVADVVREVAVDFNLKPHDVVNPGLGRKEPKFLARYEAMRRVRAMQWGCRERPSLVAIATWFGAHHSTVIWALTHKTGEESGPDRVVRRVDSVGL